MNRKAAVAVAVGALLAAPAPAQTGRVQIYGKLYPQFAVTKADGATAPGAEPSNLVAGTATGDDHPRRGSVDAQNSYLGFRGEEKLDGSLAVLWQIEQSLGFDTGATDTWGTRDSFLGLRGSFGTLKLGFMDTIYKEYGDPFGMMGVGSGNFTSSGNSLSMIGIGRDNAARFSERKEDSVQYQTPALGKLTFGIQYSPDELWSHGVKYEGERLYVSVQQERHDDFFGGSKNATAVANTGANARSKDTATRLSAAYRLTREHTLTADLARLKYKESGQGGAGEFEKYARTNWAIGWETRWGGGPVRTAAQYIRMNEGSCSLTGGVACSSEGLDGSHLNLGAAYDLSRRTFLFALFSRLINGEAAQFDNWPNGSPARGADTTQLALGVQHAF